MAGIVAGSALKGNPGLQEHLPQIKARLFVRQRAVVDFDNEIPLYLDQAWQQTRSLPADLRRNQIERAGDVDPVVVENRVDTLGAERVSLPAAIAAPAAATPSTAAAARRFVSDMRPPCPASRTQAI